MKDVYLSKKIKRTRPISAMWGDGNANERERETGRRRRRQEIANERTAAPCAIAL